MKIKLSIAPLLLLASLLVACSFGGSEGSDGGTDLSDGSSGLDPCVDDSDCTAPETCQDDGYCRYVPGPDPDVNRLNGTFDLFINDNEGECLVTGKMDGKSVYMEWGWTEYDPPMVSTVDIYLYGILTSDLYRILLLRLPADSALDAEIGFGSDGPASGSVERLRVDDDGYVVEQISEAEIVGGNVVLSRFGTVNGAQVKGTFTVKIRPADPEGE